MADSSDMKAHETTYSRMIGMLKWGTLTAVLLTALVIWLIS